MHCTGCGDRLLDNNQFCVSCGKKVDAGAGAGAGSNTAFSTAVGSFGGAGEQGQTQGQGQANPEQKSKLVAGILALLIGTYGVHNFYLGFTKKGVWQVLLSTLFGVLTFGITTMIVAIWAMIEGITILCSSNGKDAKGIPLKDSF